MKNDHNSFAIAGELILTANRGVTHADSRVVGSVSRGARQVADTLVNRANAVGHLMVACEAAQKFIGTLTTWSNSDPDQQAGASTVYRMLVAALDKSRAVCEPTPGPKQPEKETA